MALSPLAGKPAPTELLIDVRKLVDEYQRRQPDLGDAHQLVSFGTSGHRGTPLDGSFTAAHILAITQAICEYRKSKGIDGPLFLGKDTHALSGPAQHSALEVLAANGIDAVIQQNDGDTPTPVISRAILVYNRGRSSGLADGVVITPSHNPPRDGGFKYNPPNGGPADTDVTGWIQDRANQLLRAGNSDVRRLPYETALRADTTRQQDYIQPYVDDLRSILDMDAIRSAGLKLAVDPLGGASLRYWEQVAETYRLNLTVVNKAVDPTFAFMTVDHDGQIRMDCSSVYAMASLVKLKDSYAVAWGNDPDSDRHGIVTPSAGLMNPNHYLAVAIDYLYRNRPNWAAKAGVGKTLVSSSIIDRVAASLGRKLIEVPVGFKWFVPGLFDGSLGFGGEESAGASFLRWTAPSGRLTRTVSSSVFWPPRSRPEPARTPASTSRSWPRSFGMPLYARIDQAATPRQKDVLKKLSPEAVKDATLAGEPILARLTRAPGNDAAVGGLKVVAANGWFAARPSGTEDVYKIYAESLKNQAHLDAILAEARQIVGRALAAAGA